VVFACFVLSLAVAFPGHAATVTNLKAEHRNGQTFLTWDNLPGRGWIYHVFATGEQIVDVESLERAREVALLGDDSAIDTRMSELTGATVTYRLDEQQQPLRPTQGMCVVTPPSTGLTNYCVLAEKPGVGYDPTLKPGVNATEYSVFEQVVPPVPVWQRTLTNPPVEDYVLFTSHTSTLLYPAMCNQAGRAFHVGVIKGNAGAPLVMHGHGRGGSFLNSSVGTGVPGEWVLAIDDYLPTGDFASFYYGYEASYDLETPYNFPRSEGGVVVDYTERRVMHLLDWANRTMLHDRERVYAMGTSMGGSFAFFLAWRHPDRIAGALAVVPKLCLGDRDDMFPGLAASIDRIWGPQELNLPTTGGDRVFDVMDARQQARLNRHRGSAPVVGFVGLNDNSVGWAEKVAYFRTLQQEQAGGAWFWDERDHYESPTGTAWYPMMTARQLYKYTVHSSYPAFSNCSTDGQFGDGDPSTADPIGQINGAVDWDESSVNDMWLSWSANLHTRSMSTLEGVLGAPAELTVDVTPRRLQRFIVATGVPYRYEVRRTSDGELLQTGIQMADEDAVLTVPGVRVTSGGVSLTLQPTTIAGVDPSQQARFRPHLSLSRNPVRDGASLRVEWPGEGDASIDLVDIQGRVVRNEFKGAVSGVTQRSLRTEGLAPGLYLVTARQGEARTTKRVTILH
jgi:pimeloyl-ACP methyl ester carboxylesterase